jgi:hypothetical protein
MNGNSGAAAGSRSLVWRSCRNYGLNPLKTRDSARDFGALARVLSASEFGGMLGS